jgi:hypothetical protein
LVTVADRQAQKKFKHALAFGVEGPYGRQNAERFKRAVATHASHPTTEVIEGVLVRGFRAGGVSARFFLNRETRLVVVASLTGEFVTGFRLSPQQMHNLLTTRRLGGG